jgi:putative peptidoglycan lipid II flippase
MAPQSSADRTAVLATPVAAAMPAGTVLAGRYRLEELLAGSEPTVTWRALDQVLSRSVLVHLLPPRDPGAVDLLNAARSASAATDSRFLRVLDAVYSEDPRLGSYIVCEYATGQSLEIILRQGPLSGLEAAWVTREVADALSGVHHQGLTHRRIDPSTVIITPTGHVKIVGLMIEAALRPRRGAPLRGASTPELVDVLDLGRLLYAALVARWPDGPAFGLPEAPVIGRGWMTPRQVRAGVAPALDAVTDQILGDPPRHHAPALRTANDVVNALTKLLGTADAAGDLERRLRQPVPPVSNRPAPLSNRPAPVSSLLTSGAQVTRTVEQLPVGDPGPQTERLAAADLPSPRRVDRPMPEPAASSAPAPPPGRPESAQTTLIRQPAPALRPQRGLRSRSASHPLARSRPVAARRRVALLVTLALLVLGSGLAYSFWPHAAKQPTAAPDSSTSSSAASSGPASTASPVLPIERIRDFDPQGDPNRENPDLVDLAHDGRANTRWQTVTYYRNPKLGGLKRGVGLVLDLGRAQQVGSVTLALSGNGTAVQVRVPKSNPAEVDKAPLSSDRSWRTVTERPKAQHATTLALEKPVSTRFLLVYLTSLPKEGPGYRGGIYEVEVRS